ncbi:MAG: 50S ribosomal protein L25 [Nitrospirota bacterium]
MQRYDLNIEERSKSGKGPARQVRRGGGVPGVLYGHGRSMAISVNLAEFSKILHSKGGEHALLSLQGGGGKEERLAIVKEVQTDPVYGKLIHVDLQEVALTEKIRSLVSIRETGESSGVKLGGILQHGVREVEIESLPMDIPDQIEVDISSLKIGDSIHVRDLNIGPGIRVITDPDGALYSVVPPISEAKLTELLTAGPGPEMKEPEVVGKVKEEGAAPEAGAAPAKEKGK